MPDDVPQPDALERTEALDTVFAAALPRTEAGKPS